MARGTPMRPAGGTGGRGPTPPRRANQPRTRQAPPKPAQKRAAPGASKAAQQAQMQATQQAQARAAQARKSQQQQQVRNQEFLREAQAERQRDEAQRRTAEVEQQVARLVSVLPDGLRRSARIDLDALQRRSPAADEPPFDPGPLATPTPEPAWEDFAPGRLAGLWGGRGRQHEREAAAREALERAQEQWENAERERERQLAAARDAYQRRLAARQEEAQRYRARVARVAEGLRARDPRAVESFLRTVLRRVPLPAELPRRAEVTHQPDGERAIVRLVLPDREVVPEIGGYEYQPGPDEIRPVPRSAASAGQLYRRVLAQVALLVVRDLLDAEPALAGVTFHGLVDGGGADPACPVSFDVTREDFARLDLAQERSEECLTQLDGWASAPDPTG